MIKRDIKKSLFMNFASGSTESFESMVDLFTIISFVLIAAAFLFGLHRFEVEREIDTAQFELNEVTNRTGALHELPDDLVVIFIASENGEDFIQFTKPGKKHQKYYVNEGIDLSVILKDELEGYQYSKNINIIVLERDKKVNYALFFKVQKWIAKNKFNPVVFNFS